MPGCSVGHGDVREDELCTQGPGGLLQVRHRVTGRLAR